MKTGVVSCMSGTCSYLDRCINHPVDLKQCKETVGCKNMLHHICQVDYETKNGIENTRMTYICMECIGKSLPEPNVGKKSNVAQDLTPRPAPSPNPPPNPAPAQPDSSPNSAPTPAAKICDILDPKKANSKVKEKRSSATTHFECYLAMKNKELLAENKPPVATKIEQIKFEDIHTGNYIGEYCDYLATKAKRRCKPTESPISYPSASGYMGSIKICYLTNLNRMFSLRNNYKWKRGKDISAN